MQLSALAAEPQLKKLVLDDEKIVEKYGETIEFYIYDRIPLNQYMGLVESLTADSVDHGTMIEFAKSLMLDAKSKPILSGKKLLPAQIAMAAMQAVSQELGNL